MYHGYPIGAACTGAYRKIQRTGGLDYPLAERLWARKRTYSAGSNWTEGVVTARVSRFYEYASCRGGTRWIEYWPLAYQSKRDVTSCIWAGDRCFYTFVRGTWKAGLQNA